MPQEKKKSKWPKMYMKTCAWGHVSLVKENSRFTSDTEIIQKFYNKNDFSIKAGLPRPAISTERGCYYLKNRENLNLMYW